MDSYGYFDDGPRLREVATASRLPRVEEFQELIEQLKRLLITSERDRLIVITSLIGREISHLRQLSLTDVEYLLKKLRPHKMSEERLTYET